MTDSTQGTQPKRKGRTQELLEMVESGRIDIGRVETLLKEGAFADAVSKTTGESLLSMAIGLHDAQLVIKLTLYGANANGADAKGSPLLYKAYKTGQADLVQMLLEAPNGKKADPNVVVESGVRLLHLCAASNNTQMAELLLRHGANPNLRTQGTPTSITPLFNAMRYLYLDITELLLHYGANPNMTQFEGSGVTAFTYAISNRQSSQNSQNLIPVLQMLMDHGANPSLTTFGRFDGAVAAAIRERKIDAYQFLVRQGAELPNPENCDLDELAFLDLRNGPEAYKIPYLKAQETWQSFQKDPLQHLDRKSLLACANAGKFHEALSLRPWNKTEAETLLDTIKTMPRYFSESDAYAIDLARLERIAGRVANATHMGTVADKGATRGQS